MTNILPRDPVALMGARIAIGIMALLLVLAFLPREATPAPAEAHVIATPAIVVITATPQQPPEPPVPQQAPIVMEAAPTAAPVAAVPETAAPSRLVQNADGSVSLPGSEAWVQGQPAPAPDPQLAIERNAAAVYQQLPVAQAPNLENEQPVTVRRPHTGR